MIIETKDERQARGHPIGQDVPFAAMGGVTGFSSLMEGYLRLDDSGIGPPSLEELERPIGEDSLGWVSGARGGVLPDRVCRTVLKTLTLFQTKMYAFLYPFSDLSD